MIAFVTPGSNDESYAITELVTRYDYELKGPLENNAPDGKWSDVGSDCHKCAYSKFS